MPADHRRPKEKAERLEFEVAWTTKELGRTVQRRLLKERLDALSDARLAALGHGEDASNDAEPEPPPEVRAG